MASENFSCLPHPDICANSLELNTAASLSDDSGVPLTTNSSISSGDSYRCKYEREVCESDGEVSQLDSLEGSEGGMSGECFNTLKKGPLAPIDPPPEFQDSPQNTLGFKPGKGCGAGIDSLRRWSSSQTSFEYLKDEVSSENVDLASYKRQNIDNQGDEMTLNAFYSNNSKHLYSSDSILNNISSNIYDEPNNVISTSLSNSLDVREINESPPLPSPPPPVSLMKIRQTLCPYYQDHTRYFKAISCEEDCRAQEPSPHAYNFFENSNIHDYDLYYSKKHQEVLVSRNPKKNVCSPLSQQSQHFYNQYHYTSGNRPNSRNSVNSRLSSSHNSLNISSYKKPDDSIFITQAMSHDALLTREISDFYNVPVDSDIYAFPIDTIQSQIVHTANTSQGPPQMKKRALDRNCVTSCYKSRSNIANRNRNLLSSASSKDTLQMTIDDVKEFYHTLYSNAKQGPLAFQSDHSHAIISSNELICQMSSVRSCNELDLSSTAMTTAATTTTKNLNTTDNGLEDFQRNSKNLRSSYRFASNNDNNNINNNNNVMNTISKHTKDQSKSHPHLLNFSTSNDNFQIHNETQHEEQLQKQQPAAPMPGQEKKSQFTLNLKQKFCSIFRFRKNYNNRCRLKQNDLLVNSSANTKERTPATGAIINDTKSSTNQITEDKKKKIQFRALPPLPKKVDISNKEVATEDLTSKSQLSSESYKFTSSIEQVKNYGWYWGPLSSEFAEKVLSNEPDGSFIVRDSSDDHYIFSLSFKLNNCVRHVRIEQDQGTFSFGSYAKFKSQTITEFIEKAVEHSRSGRYLFFLHRRPEHGPMRVQLTNPVSRFKHVQSLQHMCRFVILKTVVRKDLIQTLPLPRRLLDYLNYKHCYSEQIESDTSNSQISGEGSI